MLINGPHGRFKLEDKDAKNWFIATGTGIAPFRSFVRSHNLDGYNLIHGVTSKTESIDRNEFINGSYVVCTSQDDTGDFNGRVTSYLSKANLKTNDKFYLCGNGSMVYDVKNLLRDKGISPENVLTEVYF